MGFFAWIGDQFANALLGPEQWGSIKNTVWVIFLLLLLGLTLYGTDLLMRPVIWLVYRVYRIYPYLFNASEDVSV